MTVDSDDVLVLDANGQAGLSIVRSLGRREVSVTAGSSVRFSLGRLSRYSDGAYCHPDPGASAGRFLDHLLDYLESSDHSFVVPVNDRTSVLLSMNKAEIEETGTTVAVEDWETFERAYDKGRFFALAESLRVPAPETFDPESFADVEAFADDVPYPAVVKPRSKTAWDDAGRCHLTLIDDAHYVESPDDLLTTYRRLLDRNPFLEEQEHYPLVQEVVDGRTATTVVLAEDGEIRAYFQEERIRTYPASGGNSALLRGRVEPRMLAYACKVIDALAWTGPAMVEFMETPAGEFYLIEVNGRYWGSVPFAIESGVDVPWLHYQQLRGRAVDPPDPYRTDVLHHRLLYEDVKWLNEQLHRGDPTALLSTLWSCLVGNQAFVSITDPSPTVWALCQTVGLGTRAGARRLTGGDSRGSPVGLADAPGDSGEPANQ